MDRHNPARSASTYLITLANEHGSVRVVESGERPGEAKQAAVKSLGQLGVPSPLKATDYELLDGPLEVSPPAGTRVDE